MNTSQQCTHLKEQLKNQQGTFQECLESIQNKSMHIQDIKTALANYHENDIQLELQYKTLQREHQTHIQALECIESELTPIQAQVAVLDSYIEDQLNSK